MSKIRTGQFEIKEVIEIINGYENKARSLKDNNNLSKTPHFHEIENMCIRMLKNHIMFV